MHPGTLGHRLDGCIEHPRGDLEERGAQPGVDLRMSVWGGDEVERRGNCMVGKLSSSCMGMIQTIS